MSKQKRNFWIEVVLLILIFGSIAAAIIASELKPLNQDDIKLTAADLRSFAAAGRELVAQHQAGQLTETFFNTQIQMLDDKVSSSRQTLMDSDAEAEAKQSQRAASDLAAQIGAAIDQIESSPQNESAAAQQLASLENKTKQLEERLKHE